jgi:DNA-binding transcriptional regulator YiaG
MAKLNKELLKERKERFKQIMADYGLKNLDVAFLMQTSYNKVKNWKHGSTFFTSCEEYYLLQMIIKHMPEFEKQAKQEIWDFKLDAH